ncbi:MAG: ATP-binding protein [Elusimicrobiota bacterium]
MKKISLRVKIGAFSALLVLVSVGAAGLGVYISEKRWLAARLQESQAEGLQAMAQVAREALIRRSDLLLSAYLDLIRGTRGLAYAMIIDEENRIRAHSDVTLVGRKAEGEAASAAPAAAEPVRRLVDGPDGPVVDLSVPIYAEGRRLGTARVGYTQSWADETANDALRAARRRIGLAAVASLAAGLLGALLLARYITRPIEQLRDGAKRIGEGDLKHRLDIASRDELNDLAREFNVMAEKLHELDRLKQDFVSNVTHELRSPLTSLRGYVEFLLRGDCGPLSEEQREQLIVVKNNAARLAKFIDTLLDVAKIEARKVVLHREPVSLRTAAGEMAVLFRPEAQEKGVRFTQDVPETLPPAWADADLLAEILTNLLSNAFKFTPEGGQVALSAREKDGKILISVSDTGAGIPADAVDKVFDKFEQVKPTEGFVRKTKGTGLGLTIVKGYVEAHGEKVWMESRVGEGTTVRFTLPPPPENPDI